MIKLSAMARHHLYNLADELQTPSAVDASMDEEAIILFVTDELASKDVDDLYPQVALMIERSPQWMETYVALSELMETALE